MSRLDDRVLDHRNHVVERVYFQIQGESPCLLRAILRSYLAITREKEIKGWRRAKKNPLVKTLNPKWEDLIESLFGDVGKRRMPGKPSGS